KKMQATLHVVDLLPRGWTRSRLGRSRSRTTRCDLATNRARQATDRQRRKWRRALRVKMRWWPTPNTHRGDGARPPLRPRHSSPRGRSAQLGALDGPAAPGPWAVAVMVPFAGRAARARTLEAEQLRTAAELARLRANLQPHFLFNTLSTIAGLVVEAPREARNLIGALGDLLRDSFEDKGEMQTLDDEVTWLKRYAEILETRHRGSITFRWEIAETTRKVRIPRLLLQPLLENAVKHGALRRREGAEVAVR